MNVALQNDTSLLLSNDYNQLKFDLYTIFNLFCGLTYNRWTFSVEYCLVFVTYKNDNIHIIIINLLFKFLNN